jgi:hypothetical protein
VLLKSILEKLIGTTEAEALCSAVTIAPPLLETEKISGAVLAQALNMRLFHDLLQRVPSGRAYVEETIAAGGKVVFDHGALRTVAWPQNGRLPSGRAAIARVLEPLGFVQSAVYPLERLKMTGYSYTHQEFPEDIAQFFISEFHPERFDATFQSTVTRVVSGSQDPLSQQANELLSRMAKKTSAEEFDTVTAARLVEDCAKCFGRHHHEPTLADYEALKPQSAEMAWIATEGNAFNHATDRVADVFATAEAQRAVGRAIKQSVEVSTSRRVRQTALIADKVSRGFIDDTGKRIEMLVPGSFYEFISRDRLPGSNKLDLAFDAGNATGIFKVTAAQG